MSHCRYELRSLTIVFVTLLASCSSDATSPTVPARVTAAGGMNLVGTVGSAVTSPPRVQVVGEAGTPLSGISVAWSVATSPGRTPRTPASASVMKAFPS